MQANNSSTVAEPRECRLCHRLFQPHPKARARQWVCGDDQCQWLRQRIDQQDWLERHPPDYEDWYDDYGKAWRQKHPDYQKKYRQRRKTQPRPKRPELETQFILKVLLETYRAEKKEQLSPINTVSMKKKPREKKEQLTDCFYLLQARDLVLRPLAREKKEYLATGFSCA